MKNNIEEKSVVMQTKQIHKVGTVTLGISLIVFGCLFLAHIFFPALEYEMIFHAWPVIFIFLGVEILLGTRQGSFVIDKSAVFLMIILAFFAMGMGVADYCIEITGLNKST